jgi:hypothetical protein
MLLMTATPSWSMGSACAWSNLLLFPAWLTNPDAKVLNVFV